MSAGAEDGQPARTEADGRDGCGYGVVRRRASSAAASYAAARPRAGSSCSRSWRCPIASRTSVAASRARRGRPGRCRSAARCRGDAGLNSAQPVQGTGMGGSGRPLHRSDRDGPSAPPGSPRAARNARLNDLLDLEPTLHDPVVQSGQSDPLVVQGLHLGMRARLMRLHRTSPAGLPVPERQTGVILSPVFLRSRSVLTPDGRLIQFRPGLDTPREANGRSVEVTIRRKQQLRASAPRRLMNF
jgi:hypothetical protein